MPSKILLITEGKKSEPKLFNKIITLFEIEEDISIYQYQSSIYSLYDYIKNNYDLDDISNLDIVNLLKSRVRNLNNTNSEQYLEILNQRFTDIILILNRMTLNSMMKFYYSYLNISKMKQDMVCY